MWIKRWNTDKKKGDQDKDRELIIEMRIVIEIIIYKLYFLVV